MIAEDYVSFEVAKLLKEKGFDLPCHATYDTAVTGGKPKFSEYEVLNYFPYGMKNSDDKYSMVISAPTLQMATKWLRETHSLVIEPYRTACGYLYTVSNIPYGSTKYNNGDAYNGDDENSGQWTTWEKACEDGIKYCLENLI